MSIIKQVYKLRRDFILIGLTGRTGSGCTSVAKLLSTEKFSDLRTEHRNILEDPWDNDSRKNRIVHNYMSKHWHPFRVIHASNVIFYYAFELSFEDFVKEFSTAVVKPDSKPDGENEEIKAGLQKLKGDYEKIQTIVQESEKLLREGISDDDVKINKVLGVFLQEIPDFRDEMENALRGTSLRIIANVLQKWGNNIRKYNQVKVTEQTAIADNAPACLAMKIDQIIKLIVSQNKRKTRDEEDYTHIVIDALRNPFEVLYFREQYSAFYLMSISTDEQTRTRKLMEKGFPPEAIKALDEKENGKKDFSEAYQDIDINRCIELSDIHLTHDGTEYTINRKLINQIITYLALIRHPGLIPPSPLERVMQIAYTAKLNSGCLSRQVGAVVTNDDYSVLSVGWNTVPQGQTPCSLRCLDDLCAKEDDNAYSNFEKTNPEFTQSIAKVYSCFTEDNGKRKESLIGVPLAYCFKDIYTSTDTEQEHNQVHTRAVHAEENAFLQLAKYGTSGIKGARLFTTSSCCELCAKKAYQLGISEIYYIDSYPGITHSHIIQCGSNQPVMKLFHGAIGRAYSNLFNPFLPLKDEVEALSDVRMKAIINPAAENKSTVANETNDDKNTNNKSEAVV